MRIAITGITGLLGRNLFFEILKKNLDGLDRVEILAFGRSEKSIPLKERLREILFYDGLDYLGVDKKKSAVLLDNFEKLLIPIEFDLTQEDLCIDSFDFAKVKNKPIDYFFHLAALTDFRNTPAIKRKLDEINIKGTDHVLKLISALDIGEIIYVGSAYSCGNMKGLISPDYTNLDEMFRNYYEKTKLIAETHFVKFAEEGKIKYRVFRPIGISGRLIEKPIGAISKYDIFYGWGLFFLKQKYKYFHSFDEIYDKPLRIDMRIMINFRSGLNIVPVDYAVKLIYAACQSNDSGHRYHLVNDIDIPHRVYVKMMLDGLNIEGCNLVDKLPTAMNKIEQLYYKSVGKLFTPYVIYESVKYDIQNIKSLREKIGIFCPPMNKGNFKKLIDYAKANYFGLVK